MPIREYKCKECGDVVEILEPRESPPTDCFKCETEDSMEKVLFPSKGSFHLKGGRWAKDGYSG